VRSKKVTELSLCFICEDGRVVFRDGQATRDWPELDNGTQEPLKLA